MNILMILAVSASAAGSIRTPGAPPSQAPVAIRQLPAQPRAGAQLGAGLTPGSIGVPAIVPAADLQGVQPGASAEVKPETALGSASGLAAASQERPGDAPAMMASTYDGGRMIHPLGVIDAFGDAGAVPAGSSFRFPAYNESAKIDEVIRRGLQASPLFRDVYNEFRNQGGQFLIERDYNAAYHGTGFRDRQGRAVIGLTQDTIDNGSWAFIMATVGRELMKFNSWYGVIPASAEKLAVEYAHMAMMFAEATQGTVHSWSTNLDHNHNNEGTWFVWSWYEQLHKAMTSSTVGFIDSDFFGWLRDYTAKQTTQNPAYQYSLYERSTGQHWRPGTALHQTPLPSNVKRLNPIEYQTAAGRFYGQDGNGDNQNGQNLLGYIKSWFTRRGNI